MPVQLSQTSRLERDEGGGNRLAGGEVGRVDLVEGSRPAGDLLGRVLERAVYKGAVAGQDSGRAGRDLLCAHLGVEDGWIGLSESEVRTINDNVNEELTLGMLSKTDSGTPKFLATTSFGVWAIQSAMLKVVLRNVSNLSLHDTGVSTPLASLKALRTRPCQSRPRQTLGGTRFPPRGPE